MQTVKIDKIRFLIGEKEVELTLEQVKELKKALNDLLPEPTCVPVKLPAPPTGKRGRKKISPWINPCPTITPVEPWKPSYPPYEDYDYWRITWCETSDDSYPTFSLKT